MTLRLIQLPSTELSAADQAALVNRAQSFRMTAPYGKTFERSDVYDSSFPGCCVYRPHKDDSGAAQSPPPKGRVSVPS